MSKWKPVAEMPANDELVLAYCQPDRLFPKGRMMIWKASAMDWTKSSWRMVVMGVSLVECAIVSAGRCEAGYRAYYS